MCGIVGYLGKEDALPFLLEGLRRLEYRGYDSAGVAVMGSDKPAVVRVAGKVAALEQKVRNGGLSGMVGIAHTRWATHGEPTEENAHPHRDCTGEVTVVHNGIIENYRELAASLAETGHKFQSETDTEVIAHLMEEEMGRGSDLPTAVAKTLKKLHGTYGLAVIAARAPETIVAARLGSPLVIGLGQNGNFFVASDVSALIRHTRDVIYLQDHELAVITPSGCRVMNAGLQVVGKEIERVDWDAGAAEKAGFAHYLLKEINDQPDALRNVLRGRMDPGAGDAHLGGLRDVADRLATIDRLVIVACGAAYDAGLVGEYMIEEYAGIPVEVELASEFRYRKPVLDDRTAVLFISQSGETADTLAALKEVKRKRVLALGLVNVVGSSIARETDAGVYIHAGPEISVTTTKAFMNQLGALALIAVTLGRQRNLSYVMGRRILEELGRIPDAIAALLSQSNAVRAVADRFVSITNALFIGRKYNYPIALEEALKFKEITYAHAEGYAAGEMKHGPIALIDENFLAVAIAPQDSVYEKVMSNLHEIKARRGKVIAVATEGDAEIRRVADEVFYIPKTLEMLTPLLSVVPLQLFAYWSAVVRGRDVDQPRNLAKSVTVE